jgi:hypothetical protein
MLSDDRDYAQTDVGDDNVDAVGMGGLSGTCIAANQFGGCVYSRNSLYCTCIDSDPSTEIKSRKLNENVT